MEIVRENFCVRSCDGEHDLAGVVFLPKGKAKGLFHVVHGMTEHIARYEKFMTDVASAGYICFGYDHLGHGHTAKDESELGYIAKKDGWKLLVKDVPNFACAVREKYADADAPYYLMGHSMGSFIVRLVALGSTKIDRLIIMGTGDSNPAADAGLALIGLIKAIKGDKHFSKFIDKMAFGSYNSRFKDELEKAPSPWLTTDFEIRKKYAADPYCRFKFKVGAMGDLIRLMKYSNTAEWYRRFPTDLPVLLVSGRDDVVGNYGKGVENVCRKLKDKGVDATCILYDGARHEILNDFTHEAVTGNILSFCD